MFANSRLDWRYILSANHVLISTMVHTGRLGYAIAGAVWAQNPNAVAVFGGPHPTCEPEDTLGHCDLGRYVAFLQTDGTRQVQS